MNNFLTRTLTGAAFVAVMIGCIWWSFWSMAALFLVISVLGLWEFYSLIEKNGIHIQKFYGVLLGIIFFLLFFPSITTDFPYATIAVISSLGISFIIELFKKSEKPILNISIIFFGIIYIILPFALLTYIGFIVVSMEGILSLIFSSEKDLNNYNFFILGFFLLIWSNDTFAYLVGRSIGKTKLFERISPKKTWEGFIGGIICTQGIAYLISIYFSELAPIHWHVVALIVSVFGTLGDLVESMFKRSLGVKDSGTILPGHGGILDRFDGVLLSSPFVVTYLMLVR